MNWTDIFNGIGNFFHKAFKLMPMVGNKYNMFMIVAGFIGLIIWLIIQSKYNKKADENGTLR